MAEIILNFRRMAVVDEVSPDVKHANLILGFQGEHGARTVKFHLDGMQAKWPDATPVLVCVRPGDGTQYIADGTEYDEDTYLLEWVPDAFDTTNEGAGSCQVQLIDAENNVLASSEVLTTIVRPSVYANSDPDTLPTWVEFAVTIRAEMATMKTELDIKKTQAVTAINSAKDTAVAAVNSAKDTAVSSVNSAKETSVTAVNSAKDTAVSDIGTKKTEAVNAVEAKKTECVAAVNAAGETCIQQIQASTVVEEKINAMVAGDTEAYNYLGLEV